MPQDLPVLGEFEQMVLLSVLCAEQAAGEAYGVTVHHELEREPAVESRAGRST